MHKNTFKKDKHYLCADADEGGMTSLILPWTSNKCIDLFCDYILILQIS